MHNYCFKHYLSDDDASTVTNYILVEIMIAFMMQSLSLCHIFRCYECLCWQMRKLCVMYRIFEVSLVCQVECIESRYFIVCQYCKYCA